MKLTGGSYTQDHQFAGGSGRVVGRVGGTATGDFVYQGLRAHAESSVQEGEVILHVQPAEEDCQ